MDQHTVRVIGDVHGKVDKYLRVIEGADYSIQLGDLSFYYHLLSKLDPSKHRAFKGNHDNYYEKLPIDIGDYGEHYAGNLKFFFVRGAFSIDWKLRIEREIKGVWPQTWWKEEELTVPDLECCLNLYSKCKPSLVITHDAPRSIANRIGSPNFLRSWGFDPNTFTTRTSEALEAMLRVHEPEYWIHGHFHKSYRTKLRNIKTQFVGLGELQYVDVKVDKSGHITNL